MKIKNKLYISAGISIILVVALFSLMLVTSGRIAEENKRHELAMDLEAAVSELDIVTYEYLLHHEKRMEQQWNLKYNSMKEFLEEKEEVELVKSIHADYAALGDLFSQVTTNYKIRQKLIQKRASQRKIDAANQLEERLVAQLLITSHSIITNASRLAKGAHAEAMEAQRLALYSILILLVVLAITVTTSSLLVARSISKPLNKLTSGAKKIGEGDLDHRINIKSKDEMGLLAHAFDRMTDNLKKTTASRDELNKEVVERTRAETNLRIRSTQLEAANKELEAFSYSVSHDLRAPLRAISGFSNALLEDYTYKLDDEGKRYLNVIQENTTNMGQLIDNLLSFSRMGRKQMERSDIDMSKLAKSTFEELKLLSSERTLQLKLNDLPHSSGDQSLIRQVIVNLLSNAIKYTRPVKNPVIEIGCQMENGQNDYYVKDNGVGFDMQYKDKLFGVFQRLHSSGEFEGTGVGLALVKRIVNRHGGRVWAEGKVGKGATFHFSLP